MHIFGDPQRCDIMWYPKSLNLLHPQMSCCDQRIWGFFSTPLVLWQFPELMLPQNEWLFPFFSFCCSEFDLSELPFVRRFFGRHRIQASPFSGSPRVGWCVPKTQGFPGVAVGTDFSESFGNFWGWIWLDHEFLLLLLSPIGDHHTMYIYESMNPLPWWLRLRGLGNFLEASGVWWVWWVGKGWGSGQVIWEKVWSISNLLPSGNEVFKDNEHVCMFARRGMHSLNFCRYL